MWRALAAAVVLGAAAASAHEADLLGVRLRDTPDGGLTESITATAQTLALLAPLDADDDGRLDQADLDARTAALVAGVWDQVPLRASAACLRFGEAAFLRDGYLELTAGFTCPPGELSQDFRVLRVLPAGYSVRLSSDLGGEVREATAQGRTTSVTLVRARDVPRRAAAPWLLGCGALASLAAAVLALRWRSLGWRFGALLTLFGALGFAVVVALAF
ncbi:MAG: hypothetical protein K1X89_02950 [Myxococcaceae bacterium]|nr:hypothetical protein [Myxococcaceae bacterium]